MKRVSEKLPGHACMYGVPHGDCPGRTDDRHGIGSECWYYGVVSGDGKHCLTLDVSTDIYPPELPSDHSARCGVRCDECGHGRHGSRVCGVELHRQFSYLHGERIVQQGSARTAACACPPDPIEERRRGADITLHLVAREPPAVPGWTPAQRKLPGDVGYCVSDLDTSALKADEFFRAHGDPNQFEQSESFWTALEKELAIWIEGAEKQAAEEAETARREYRPRRGDAVETWLIQCKGCLLVASDHDAAAATSALLRIYRERADANLPLLDEPDERKPT